MDFEKVKNFMDNLCKTKVPGNAVSVYLGDRKVFEYASGYSDVEHGIPMSADHFLYIYSCSKVTTVVAALQLLEQGKFLVSDPLYEYIPQFKQMWIRKENGDLTKANNPIRILNLFNMTAGFTYNSQTSAFEKAKRLTNGKMDTLKTIQCFAEDPLIYEPGTKWEYSLAHDVLAALVEAVSGQKFRDYVRENIFEPLDMQNTFYHPNVITQQNMAQQYCFVDAESDSFDAVQSQKYGKANSGKTVNVGLENGFVFGEEYDSGGAGIITTVNDYAKLCAALANYGMGVTGRRILAPETVNLMRTNTLSKDLLSYYNWEQLRGYGYGYGVRTLMDNAAAGSVSSVGEFGWCGAAGATVLVDPKYNLGVFYAHHMLNPQEPYYMPRLRNAVCADAQSYAKNQYKSDGK